MDSGLSGTETNLGKLIKGKKEEVQTHMVTSLFTLPDKIKMDILILLILRIPMECWFKQQKIPIT